MRGRFMNATLVMAAMAAAASCAAPVPPASDAATAGRPSLAGVWGGGGGGGGLNNLKVDEQGNVSVGLGKGREGTLVNFERDSGILQRSDENRPIYRPDKWELVRYLDENGNLEDPEFHCFPAGVPRMGPPAKIVESPNELVFLYNQRNTFRVIHMDGRPHPPEDEWVGRWYGHSVGRWEGNTLIIDSADFTDASWLGWPGWTHSYNMKVEERITREGDSFTWQATVTDPDFLLEPYVTNPVTRRLNPDPKAELPEDLPCSERDAKNIVTKERG